MSSPNPFAFGQGRFGVDSLAGLPIPPSPPVPTPTPATPSTMTNASGPLLDLAHFFGGDLSASSSGDLLPVSGLSRSQQRILRRLNTNPGSYIGQPSYGAGLPQFIGQNVDAAEIGAVIKGQMLLEDSVAPSPPPVVTVTQLSGAAIAVSIQYTDQPSNAPTVLAFTVSN
jgi:hypothetical protein